MCIKRGNEHGDEFSRLTKLIIKLTVVLAMSFARLDSYRYQIMRKQHNCGHARKAHTVQQSGSTEALRMTRRVGYFLSFSTWGPTPQLLPLSEKTVQSQGKVSYAGTEKACDTLDKLRIKKKRKAIKNI